QGPRHVVIMVHGTGASSASDIGNQWWLRGDPNCYPRVIWHRLNQRLAPHCECLPDGELFHWSGENSESERIAAGAKLLRLILDHEKNGRVCHLVGHSHGGSVIWSALRQAARMEVSLADQTTWTTVGTPFIKHERNTAFNQVVTVISLLSLLSTYFT